MLIDKRGRRAYSRHYGSGIGTFFKKIGEFAKRGINTLFNIGVTHGRDAVHNIIKYGREEILPKAIEVAKETGKEFLKDGKDALAASGNKILASALSEARNVKSPNVIQAAKTEAVKEMGNLSSQARDKGKLHAQTIINHGQESARALAEKAAREGHELVRKAREEARAARMKGVVQEGGPAAAADITRDMEGEGLMPKKLRKPRKKKYEMAGNGLFL
jgi:vacuolar-type H+-ATPase subunit H